MGPRAALILFVKVFAREGYSQVDAIIVHRVQ